MLGDAVPDFVLAETHAVRTYVDSYYDGELIAEDIPLLTGVLDIDSTLNIPGRLDLTFPGVYAPSDWTDPLGIYGQRLVLRQVLSIGNDEWTVDLGQYLIQGWDDSGKKLAVEALSLEQLILDYRFSSPYKRPSGATFAGQLGAIVKGVLPVDTSAMTNRSLPASLAEDWEEDRMAAVRAIQTNWPCDLRVDVDGVLVASPVRSVAENPDVEWVHGEANAYMASTGGKALRDDIYNAVVVRGEKANGAPVQATIVDNDPSSPTYYYGPYGRRQRFYESPLVTSRIEARETAATLLAKEKRKTAVIEVQAPPDPRIEMLDTARVTLADGTSWTGLVTSISLPLTTADGEPARYGVALEQVIS